MIKKYTDELMKMSREKALPDTEEEAAYPAEETDDENMSELFPFETEARPSPADIPGIEETDFYEETAEEFTPEEDAELTGYATFSARVFTGNSAYPIKNAKVLIVKDDILYTYLTTDRDGTTKKIRLPSYPEDNSFIPESDRKAVEYTGEVYATGFTPKKNLLISAVGGSEIILDVQMTPISAEVN